MIFAVPSLFQDYVKCAIVEYEYAMETLPQLLRTAHERKCLSHAYRRSHSGPKLKVRNHVHMSFGDVRAHSHWVCTIY